MYVRKCCLKICNYILYKNQVLCIVQVIIIILLLLFENTPVKVQKNKGKCKMIKVLRC